MIKKKLAIICTSSHSLINFRYELIKKLNKFFRIDTFSEDQNYLINKQLNKLKIKNYAYKKNITSSKILNEIFSISNLRNLFNLKKKKYDVIFVFTIKSIIYSFFIRSQNAKYIFLITGLGFLFEKTNSVFIHVLKKILIIFLKYQLKIGDQIFFQNKDDKRLFLKKKILKNDTNVHLINGSGVNLKKFSFKKNTPKIFTVLMISRIIRSKGINDFFETVKILKKKDKNINFIFCGQRNIGVNEYDYSDFIDQIKKLKIKLFIDSLRVDKIIMNSSVVVLPTPYREGVPRSLLEAISSGRPVIGTNVPGVREVVLNKWNGYLIPKNSPNILANCILKLKRNKNDYNRFRYNSRKLAEEKFDVKIVNKFFLSKISKFLTR